MKITNYFLIIGLGLSMSLHTESYTYAQFLQMVGTSNSAYLAEKFNIDIAIAEQQAAKVFNDPEISFTYGNNQDWNLQMGQSYEAGLSYTIPFGPVRSSQMRVAAAMLKIEEAAVADYWCSLKLEAAEAYASAWLAKQQALYLEENWHMMEQIAHGDSLRLEIGDLNAMDAMQSFLESISARSLWLEAKYAYRNALAELSVLIGGKPVDDVELPEQEIMLTTLEELQHQALLNRSDLQMAYSQHTLSEQALRLVKAERAPEITLGANYIHSTEVRNELAPAPQYDGFTVGVSMPIKFSSANKGARLAAEHKVEQADLYYQAVCTRINAEVAQAYNQYLMTVEVLSSYNSSILTQAQQIQHSRQLAYEQGEIGLVQLLEANRTYRETLTNYFSSVANHFMAAATLMRSIGM